MENQFERTELLLGKDAIQKLKNAHVAVFGVGGVGGFVVEALVRSALMTTTVVSMEDTIKAIRAAGLDTKVWVGGAVLTQEYADMIGADKYCKDALSSVTYANEFFGN